MTAWRVLATPAEIDNLRSNEAFAEALALGRIANLVRTCLSVGIAHGPADGTGAERIRSSVTLLLSGLLAEAFPLLERSGKHFRHLPSFATAIQPILSDSGVAQVRREWLSPLRNKAVFHNDKEVSLLGLAAFHPDDDQSLARGSSDAFLDLYYPMADLVAISYVFAGSGTAVEAEEFLRQSALRVIQLAQRVCAAIDEVVGDALHEWGFELEECGDPPA